MKLQQLPKLIGLSLLIAVVISIINFWLTKNPFVLKNEVVIYAINFMFAFTITVINTWYFYYLSKFYSWSERPTFRFLLGALGSVILTVSALFVLQAITSIGFFGNSWEQFLAFQSLEIYIGSLVMTFIVASSFHAIHFYKELQSKKLQEQKVIATSASAQFDALKNQLDPHFLFNSLNVLVSLIEENPDAAVTFTTALSKVYRYVLEQRNKALIPVDEELEFARTYVKLLKMRFEDSIEVSIPVQASNPDTQVVPLSLQLLIENAVKHNVISTESPLQLRIYEDNDMLVIENNLQVKEVVKSSSGVGLQNIVKRYALLSNRKMTVDAATTVFKVRIPLLKETEINHNIKPDSMTTIEEMRIVQAKEQVAELKDFYGAISISILIISLLAVLNYLTSDFPWVIFPTFFMSMSLLFKYLKVSQYNIPLGKKWEQNKIETLMNDPKF